ncbi:MAG: hypothetical protein WC198_07855, partial [Victivallaceae bacterium]
INFGAINRVVVPDQAIIKQAGSGARFVYLLEGNKVSYRQIELGRRMEKEYELISGIESDAEVVVSGQGKLADGIAVEVIQ